MGEAKKSRQDIVQEVRKNPTQKVKLAIVDIDGILRGKVVHLDKFESVLEGGFGFCDVIFGWDAADNCYTKGSYTGSHTGFPDAPARVDIATYRNVPWDRGLPFFLADFDGGPAANLCPRTLLKRVRKKAYDMGFCPLFAQEYEWFNFKENPDDLHNKEFLSPRPLTPGMFGYSLLRAASNREYFNDLFDSLRHFGIPLEGLHTETGPGVYEGAILYDEILEAADRSALFKGAVKEVAQSHGIVPSFMAKWNDQLPGCSGHLHQSLFDVERKRNLFYDPNAKDKISQTMKHYMAGLLEGLPVVLPLLAPTVNSYKRYVDGLWAPTTSTWGIDNRTTSIRALPLGEKSTRIEFRVPGSDINPYLAMAASLACGLYGIENKLELGPPVVGDGYDSSHKRTFAKNLKEATQAMKASPLPAQLFGEQFCQHFIETREWEWEQFEGAITNWEMKRYFEII